jgi:hypothetical protein
MRTPGDRERRHGMVARANGVGDAAAYEDCRNECREPRKLVPRPVGEIERALGQHSGVGELASRERGAGAPCERVGRLVRQLGQQLLRLVIAALPEQRLGEPRGEARLRSRRMRRGHRHAGERFGPRISPCWMSARQRSDAIAVRVAVSARAAQRL